MPMCLLAYFLNSLWSIIVLFKILNVNINIGCPKKYQPSKEIISRANVLNQDLNLNIYEDPQEAVFKSSVIYTDVWTSMGQEIEADDKEEYFKNYIVDKNLLSEAANNHIVMHCLPAYRGKEITDEIIESQNSKIFDQAENRLHAQHALLSCLLS